MITIEKIGRRYYLAGNTFAAKDAIKAAGGHWDGDRRQWWVSKADVADQFAAGIASEAKAAASSEGVADDARVLGKAKHKGRTYYVLWRGRTKAGKQAAKLAFLDGSKQFWADESDIEMIKTYEPRSRWNGRRGSASAQELVYQTFGGLRDYAERMKNLTPQEREHEANNAAGARNLGGRCRCEKPLDEGDGECMYCGYFICG